MPSLAIDPSSQRVSAEHHVRMRIASSDLCRRSTFIAPRHSDCVLSSKCRSMSRGTSCCCKKVAIANRNHAATQPRSSGRTWPHGRPPPMPYPDLCDRRLSACIITTPPEGVVPYQHLIFCAVAFRMMTDLGLLDTQRLLFQA